MGVRRIVFALCASLAVGCAQEPAALPADAAGLPIVVDADDVPVRDAVYADADDGALDASEDAWDATDADDATDAVSQWDIILPDVVDAGAVHDAASLPDVVIERADVVPMDRPDVVQTPDVVIERPDVVAIDRPDVVAAQDVVAIDRPDVVVVDRPDVVVVDRPDVVVVDRPDVVVMDRPDVVVMDRPDVVAAQDVVTVDRPDVPTVTDAGAGVPSPDPVSYSGTFPVRTGVFSVTLTIAGERRAVRLAVPTAPVTSPPLILLFHGTNGDGAQVMTEANAAALANAEGVIIAAPSSRWLPVGDFDHATEETYWETQRNPFPNANQDVLLARAIMVEAQRVYGVDPARIYAMGHSNGGFFALFLSSLLQDRIAAFSVNAAGLVTCARTTACGFRGSGTTCATLSTRTGWCGCAGPELPIPLPTSGRRVPGSISHGTQDPLVSVFYACTLEARMTALGWPVQTTLFNGEGHVIPPNWAQMVWPFFRTRRLYP